MRPTTMPVTMRADDRPTLPPNQDLAATLELYVAHREVTIAASTIVTRPAPPPAGPMEPFREAPSFAPYRMPKGLFVA